jgi:DUF4097 and DUF4098 domain-containing protein YvlB
MKAREVILAIFIILAGTFVTSLKTGRLSWNADIGDFTFHRGEEFVFEETSEIPAPLLREIEIRNAHGTVAVEGGDAAAVTITFTKRVYRRTRAEAQRIADRIRMDVDRTDPRLVLSTNREEFRRRPFETDFKVTVPTGTAVFVRNSYGLVRAGRTGRTEISNRHGEVLVSTLSGPLVLENSYENVEVDGVQGEARLACPHSDVVVRNVQGDLFVDHNYGKLRCEKIGNRLTIHGSHSEVFAKDIGGDAEIQSSYEPITVSLAKAVTIRGHHSEIDVNETEGTCDVANSYGPIRVSGLKGDLIVDGRKAEVIGRLIRAGTISVATTYEKVELIGFSGGASVRIGHARLLLEPETITGPIDVQGSYADVAIRWPAGARHPFEAETRQGTIHWDLGERPSVETSNGVSVTKAFLEATDKPAVKIATSYGDIRVGGPGARF